MGQKSLKRGLLGSLLVHALLVIFGLIAPKLFPPATLPQLVQIDFTEPKPAASPTATPVDTEKLKQIVDQDEKAINNEIDKDAKFLSRNNQKVQKQTVATNHGDFRNAQGRYKGAETDNKPAKGKSLSLDDLKPKMDFAKAVEAKKEQEKIFDQESEVAALDKAKKQAEKRQEASRGENGQKGGEQVSQTLDYIKELDPGLETMLSTREFVFFSFYARIREQLNQHWGPKIREKISQIYQQGRNIASTEDKITKLLVTLDSKGYLLKVQIIGISGLREIDEAAVEAFKASQPFLNPPKGIIDADGTIKIRWDFILEA